MNQIHSIPKEKRLRLIRLTDLVDFGNQMENTEKQNGDFVCSHGGERVIIINIPGISERSPFGGFKQQLEIYEMCQFL